MKTKYVCDNCGESHTDKTLRRINSYEEAAARLDEGYGLVPSGECRKCGSFCYPQHANLVVIDMTMGKINRVLAGVPWLNVVIIDRARSGAKKAMQQITAVEKAGELSEARITSLVGEKRGP